MAVDARALLENAQGGDNARETEGAHGRSAAATRLLREQPTQRGARLTSQSMSALERPTQTPIPPCLSERSFAERRSTPLGRPLAISEAMSVSMLSRLNLLDVEADEVDTSLSVRRTHTLSALDLSSTSVLDNVRTPLPMSSAEALMNMIKGNLGAGCLALPLAFATAGIWTALGLFALVAAQGTYSMLVLARLKGVLCSRGLRVHTFEDIGSVAFGAGGRRWIEALVVTLQLGICCIYISLLTTNLRAGLGGRLSQLACWAATSAACAALSLLRNMSALWPLSTAANALMLCACVTAVAVSCAELISNGGPLPPAADAASAASLARCLGVLFFAYEGAPLRFRPLRSALRRLLEARWFSRAALLALSLRASLPLPSLPPSARQNPTASRDAHKPMPERA